MSGSVVSLRMSRSTRALCGCDCQVLPHRPEPGEDAIGVLVVDRRHHRNPRQSFGGRRRRRRGSPGGKEPDRHHRRTSGKGPEGLRQPQDEDREHRSLGQVEIAQAVGAQDLDEARNSPSRGGEDQKAEDPAADAGAQGRATATRLEVVGDATDTLRRSGRQETPQPRCREPPVDDRTEGPAPNAERLIARRQGAPVHQLAAARRSVGQEPSSGSKCREDRLVLGQLRPLGGTSCNNLLPQSCGYKFLDTGRAQIGAHPQIRDRPTASKGCVGRDPGREGCAHDLANPAPRPLRVVQAIEPRFRNRLPILGQKATQLDRVGTHADIERHLVASCHVVRSNHGWGALAIVAFGHHLRQYAGGAAGSRWPELDRHATQI